MRPLPAFGWIWVAKGGEGASRHLEDGCADGESKVFYKKMKGDYWRYLAEFKGGTERKEAAEQTLLAYKAAEATAEAELASTHPIRLGLALNFSVFYSPLEFPLSDFEPFLILSPSENLNFFVFNPLWNSPFRL